MCVPVEDETVYRSLLFMLAVTEIFFLNKALALFNTGEFHVSCDYGHIVLMSYFYL